MLNPSYFPKQLFNTPLLRHVASQIHHPHPHHDAIARNHHIQSLNDLFFIAIAIAIARPFHHQSQNNYISFLMKSNNRLQVIPACGSKRQPLVLALQSVILNIEQLVVSHNSLPARKPAHQCLANSACFLLQYCLSLLPLIT